MFYVGLDIHTKRISICVLNETGPVVQRTQLRSLAALLRLRQDRPERCAVCDAARCGDGHFSDW